MVDQISGMLNEVKVEKINMVNSLVIFFSRPSPYLLCSDFRVNGS